MGSEMCIRDRLVTTLNTNAVLRLAVEISPTCRVCDKQPVSVCGISGRVTVKIVSRSPDVASRQLDARHHHEDVSTTLAADRPLAINARRVLARPVGTSNESSADNLTFRRLRVNPSTRTRPAFVHSRDTFCDRLLKEDGSSIITKTTNVTFFHRIYRSPQCCCHRQYY